MLLDEHMKRAGYAQAMADIYRLMSKEVQALRVVMMQNPAGSDEFKSAFDTIMVLDVFSKKLKELINVPEQKH